MLVYPKAFGVIKLPCWLHYQIPKHEMPINTSNQMRVNLPLNLRPAHLRGIYDSWEYQSIEPQNNFRRTPRVLEVKPAIFLDAHMRPCQFKKG